MSKYLMVPICLDALYVQGEELSVVEQNANFAILPFFENTLKQEINCETANISESIVSRPFQNKNLRLGHGIHLHWALPDALTRGDSGLNFPQVPDRWLVTRRKKNGEQWDVHKQWVVESDYLFPPWINKHGVSVNIPFAGAKAWKKSEGTQEYTYKPKGYEYNKSELPENIRNDNHLLEKLFEDPNKEVLVLKEASESDDPFSDCNISKEDKKKLKIILGNPLNRASQPFRFMGRKMPVTVWKESFPGAEYYPSLTAMGYGEPTFAAFYPNCFSVFGLHDNLADIKGVALTDLRYELVGWYSENSYVGETDRIKDPLAKLVQKNSKVSS